MKLLILQETDWLKRYPIQQHHLAEKLSQRGHQIHVIDFEILWNKDNRNKLYSTRSIFKDVARIYKGAKVTVFRPGIVKVPCLDYLSLIFSHKKEIDLQIAGFAPDVIIGLDILNAYIGAKAARINKIPFIYYWIDVNHELIPFKPFRHLGKFIESRTLKLADLVLVLNDKLREYVVRLGADPSKVATLKLGIDIKKYNPSLDGAFIRERYGIRPDDLVLFFMGWLYHFSGLKEIIVEMSRARDRTVKLLIVGDGDAYEDIQNLVSRYKLDKQVILAGRQPYDEIPEHIAAADICLLPAHGNDTMLHIVPIKLYEYIAMGKPVIATRLPGVIKEFGDNCGIFYIDGPKEALGKALELHRDSELMKKGIEGRKFVENSDWDNITGQLEQLLEDLI